MTDELFAKLDQEVPIYANLIESMMNDILAGTYEESSYRGQVNLAIRFINELKKEHHDGIKLFAIKMGDVLSDVQYLASDKTGRKAKKILENFEAKVESMIELFSKILMKGVV